MRLAGRGTVALAVGDRPVQLRRERRLFLKHNAVASLGNLVAGLFGFVMQATVSHQLHPLQYGEAFAVYTLFTLVSLPAAGLTRLVAWNTSKHLASSGDTQAAGSLLRSANRWMFLIGSVIAGSCILLAHPIGDFLNVPSRFIIASAVGLPFQMSIQLLLGSLQGEQRFNAWSALGVAAAVSKCVAAAVLAVRLGAAGVLLGISLASVLSYVFALSLVRDHLRQAAGRADWRAVGPQLLLMILSSLAVPMLMSSDVLLVTHLFQTRRGGEYSAVAALTRGIFWATAGVATVILPKVTARHAKGHSTVALVFGSLLLAAVGGGVVMAAFSAEGTPILTAFSGRGYAGGASYMGWYGLGMALLAAVAVLINAHQAFARFALLWVLVPMTLAKPILILLFHRTLLMVVMVGDLAIAVLLVMLVVLYAVEERVRLRTLRTRELSTATVRPAEAGVRRLMTLVVIALEPTPALQRSLEAMRAATTAHPTEMIVACTAPWPGHPDWVRVVHSPASSLGDRLDHASRGARGELIAFVDQRVRLGADWQERAFELLAGADLGVVGGPVLPRAVNRRQRVAALVLRSRMGVAPCPAMVRVRPARSVAEVSITNLIVRRQAFVAVGGFQCPSVGGESVRLCYKVRRLLQLGVVCHPALAVQSSPPPMLRPLLVLVRDQARARGDLARRLPETTPLVPNVLPVLGTLAVALLLVAGSMHHLGRFALLLVAAVLLVQVLNVLTGRGSPLDKLLACLAVPLVPATYAAGFMAGYLGRSRGEVSPQRQTRRGQRILVCNWRDRTHPWAGGAEYYMHEMARRWVAQGHEVSWLCERYKSGRRSDIIDGIRFHRVGGRYTLYPLAAAAYLLRLRRHCDVIVDCENGIPFFTPLYSRKPVVLMVYHVHQEVFRAYLPPVLRWLALGLEGWLMPRVYRRKRVVTISESTRSGLVDCGFDPARIEVVYCGVDPPRANGSEPPSPVPALLCVGRLKPYKRVDVLIQAMPAVLERFPEAVLDIVGQGPDRSRLERLTWSLGLAHRVRFHGYVTRETRELLSARAWVSVCPSEFEGWGMVCVEASARGIPVVASRVAGLRDAVVEGVTGVLVPPGDPDALADEVVGLLADPARRHRMGSIGRSWAVRFSWDQSAARFGEIIAGLSPSAVPIIRPEPIEVELTGREEVAVSHAR